MRNRQINDFDAGAAERLAREEFPEIPALLTILALGNQDVEAGWVTPVADVVARLRVKHTIQE